MFKTNVNLTPNPQRHAQLGHIAATAVIEITDLNVFFYWDGTEAQVSLGRLALPAVAPATESVPVFQRTIYMDDLFLRVGNTQLLKPTHASAELVINKSDFSLIR